MTTDAVLREPMNPLDVVRLEQACDQAMLDEHGLGWPSRFTITHRGHVFRVLVTDRGPADSL
jgi:hypothetical protein